jgi:hypothetical protein
MSKYKEPTYEADQTVMVSNEELIMPINPKKKYHMEEIKNGNKD